jgi:hypothetical protein
VVAGLLLLQPPANVMRVRRGPGRSREATRRLQKSGVATTTTCGVSTFLQAPTNERRPTPGAQRLRVSLIRGYHARQLSAALLNAHVHKIFSTASNDVAASGNAGKNAGKELATLSTLTARGQLLCWRLSGRARTREKGLVR